MESSLSEQSSMANKKSHVVVNYRSSSYGGYLFRSPNSPPPSPSRFPSPPIASLNQIFLSADPGSCGIQTTLHQSLPSFTAGSILQLRQPPLLPLPRSATHPAPNQRIAAGTAAIAARSRRAAHPKRKAKASSGTRKVDSKEEGKSAKTRTKEEERPAYGTREFEEITVEAKDMVQESVFSKSPPPSSLPFPRFSLSRPKAVGGSGTTSVGYCTVEAVVVSGGVDVGVTDDLMRVLRI